MGKKKKKKINQTTIKAIQTCVSHQNKTFNWKISHFAKNNQKIARKSHRKSILPNFIEF